MREQDEDVGLEREAAEQLGEPRLHLGRVQGEELLELVDDQQRLLVPAAATGRPRTPPRRGRRRRPARRIASESPASSEASALAERSERLRSRVCSGRSAQPLAALGIRPALRNEVLPAPDGPTMPSMCGRSSLRHICSTSASRPKKYSASSSVKEARPG